MNVENELAEANARLPIIMDSSSVPLPMQMRAIALVIAQRHIGDTVIKEGALYNALKMAGTEIRPVELDNVISAALVFERYLWGKWSRGIAENALQEVLTEAADAIEKELKGGG